jgi:sialate O-acetylesterase
VLWYQGESDAFDLKAAPLFRQKFERFVAAVRKDVGQPDLPFYYVQIGRLANVITAEWNQIQDAQRQAELAIPNAYMVPAIDCALDDTIHIGTQGFKRLGLRLAKLASGQAKRGPRPISAKFDNGVVSVRFSDVNGGLRSAGGRLFGFSIHGPGGELLPLIYSIQIDPADRSIVRLYTRTKPLSHFAEVGGALPPGATLHYGYGKDPYCNLTDSEDMGMPVFGPLKIE